MLFLHKDAICEMLMVVLQSLELNYFLFLRLVCVELCVVGMCKASDRLSLPTEFNIIKSTAAFSQSTFV